MNPYGTAALVCFIVAFAASGTGAVIGAWKGLRWAASIFTFLAAVSIAAFAYYGIQ